MAIERVAKWVETCRTKDIDHKIPSTRASIVHFMTPPCISFHGVNLLINGAIEHVDPVRDTTPNDYLRAIAPGDE